MNCTCDMHGPHHPGLKFAHCRKCCITFTTPGAFNQHIRAVRHRRPEDVGLVQRKGRWGYPARPTLPTQTSEE